MQPESETLELSPSTSVEVRELNGHQVSKADLLLADELGGLPGIEPGKTPSADVMARISLKSSMLSGTIYAVCSIVSINGSPVTPLKNQAEYIGTASQLKASEMKKLLAWAQPLYNPTEQDSKNDSGSALASA